MEQVSGKGLCKELRDWPMHVISVYYLSEFHYAVLKSGLQGFCAKYPDPGINLCFICLYHSRVMRWGKLRENM